MMRVSWAVAAVLVFLSVEVRAQGAWLAEDGALAVVHGEPAGVLLVSGARLPILDLTWTSARNASGALAVEPLVLEVPMSAAGLEIRRWLLAGDQESRSAVLLLDPSDLPSDLPSEYVEEMDADGGPDAPGSDGEGADVGDSSESMHAPRGAALRLDLQGIAIVGVCSILGEERSLGARERWELVPASVTWSVGNGTHRVTLDLEAGTSSAMGTWSDVPLLFAPRSHAVDATRGPLTYVLGMEHRIGSDGGVVLDDMQLVMLNGPAVPSLLEAAWSGSTLASVELRVASGDGITHRFEQVAVRGFRLHRARSGPTVLDVLFEMDAVRWTSATDRTLRASKSGL